jgi:preprotein translocase subunit SecG
MYTALIVLHIIVAFIMIGVILLQSGKGAEIGAAFGGSSQTVFGARGANTLLSKLTAISAAIFMVTSLSLAILSKQKNYSSPLGLDKPVPGQTTPAAPATQAVPTVPTAPGAPPARPTAEPAKDDHGTHNPNPTTPTTPAPTKP